MDIEGLGLVMIAVHCAEQLANKVYPKYDQLSE
jgi:hypothetical protein